MRYKVLFTISTSILSRLIRRVTGEEFSHCGILLPSGHVLHINLLGLQVETLDSFQLHNTIMDSVEIPVPEVHNPLDIVVGNGRMGYDYKAFFMLFVRFTMPFIKIGKNAQVPGMYVCSEFVYNILEHAELSVPKTPGQLHSFLKEKYSNV